MVNRMQLHKTAVFPFLLALVLMSFKANANADISLYTPYTKLSVPPGETVEYSIEVKNSGTVVKNIDILVSRLLKDWNYTLKAGGYSINQVSVLPGEKKTLTLKIEVPRSVSKGNHTFNVIAKDFDVLPLIINVSEQGTFKTEFTASQMNMQGHSKSEFMFSATIKNQTGENQVYGLIGNPPAEGWSIIFKPNGKQATAVEVSPNSSASVSIEIKPPYTVSAGTYKIPVQASNRSTSAQIELEVVIIGNYEMQFTTPNGLLSTKLTAGKAKVIDFEVKNTGSTALKDISFKSSQPKNWDVTFSPDKINSIEAGGTEKITVTIKADDKAIPGDYVTNLTAQTKETKSTSELRISIVTPLMWGWLGIVIILATLAVIYFLFRKYGRR
jgi:uncharacterized membrane protein